MYVNFLWLDIPFPVWEVVGFGWSTLALLSQNWSWISPPDHPGRQYSCYFSGCDVTPWRSVGIWDDPADPVDFPES